MDTHIVENLHESQNTINFEACNILFNVAEQSQFKKITNIGYHKQTARNLLGMVYDQLQSDMKKLIDDKTGTLVQDVWSSVTMYLSLLVAYRSKIISPGNSFHWIHVKDW